MIFRTSTCLTMLLAAGAGLYLYQTKHRSQMLDREIVHTIKATEQVRERSNLLRGEWAVLNEPDRLAELAKQHAQVLRNPAATQFVSLADLPSRMPAPLPPGSFPVVPDEDAAVAAAAPAQPLPRLPVVAEVPAKPAEPVAKPVVVAAAAKPAPPQRPVRTAEAAKPVEPAAHRFSAPVVAVAAASIAPGNYIGESVARVSRGLPPLPAPGGAYATPVASVLGGAARASLPPPIPYNGN